MKILNKITSHFLVYATIFSLVAGNFPAHAMYAFNIDDCEVDARHVNATCRFNPNSKICPGQTVYDYGYGFLIGCVSSFVANWAFKHVEVCCNKECISERIENCCCPIKIRSNTYAAREAERNALNGVNLTNLNDSATSSSKPEAVTAGRGGAEPSKTDRE